MWRLVCLAEIVEQRLGVFGLEVDYARERAFEMRIIGIEAIDDELGMVVVLGENDRLTKAITVRYLETLRHQVFKYLVDRVVVEQPLIDGRSLDLRRDRARLVPFDRVPVFLLFLRKIIIADALADKPQRDRDRTGRYQVAIPHSLIEAIGVRRHSPLEIKEAIGVAIDLVLRRRG